MELRLAGIRREWEREKERDRPQKIDQKEAEKWKHLSEQEKSTRILFGSDRRVRQCSARWI